MLGSRLSRLWRSSCWSRHWRTAPRAIPTCLYRPRSPRSVSASGCFASPFARSNSKVSISFQPYCRGRGIRGMDLLEPLTHYPHLRFSRQARGIQSFRGHRRSDAAVGISCGEVFMDWPCLCRWSKSLLALFPPALSRTRMISAHKAGRVLVDRIWGSRRPSPFLTRMA